MTDYTGFHGGDPLQQEGNYIALKASATEGSEVTVELVGSDTGKGAIKLDPDMQMVFRITNKTKQSIKLVATKDGERIEQTYQLSNLTLETKPD